MWIAAIGPQDRDLRHPGLPLYRAEIKYVIDSHGGEDMGEYKHGSMDTTEQEKTFHGLLKASAIVAIISILALIFLAFVGTNPT
jgi:hypothetical protein